MVRLSFRHKKRATGIKVHYAVHMHKATKVHNAQRQPLQVFNLARAFGPRFAMCTG